MFCLNRPRASTSLTLVNYLSLYNHTALKHSVVWHCLISFWDCVARIEMQYRNWIWLGMGVDTEALCVVATDAGGKLLHSPTTGHWSSWLCCLPWLKCGLYSSSKIPVLRTTCTLQRFGNGKNNTGASIPPPSSADVIVLPKIVDCPPNSTD